MQSKAYRESQNERSQVQFIKVLLGEVILKIINLLTNSKLLYKWNAKQNDIYDGLNFYNNLQEVTHQFYSF